MYRTHGLKTIWLVAILLWVTAAQAAVGVKAVRLWPSPEYSRITLELSDNARFHHFLLQNPNRLVLDLEGVDPGALLLELNGKLAPQDPVIGGLRVALNRPGVTRLVVDLKTEVRPQVFTLQPMGEYGHRLVLDLYSNTADTLEKLIEQAIARADSGGSEKAAVGKVSVKEGGKPTGNAAPDQYKRLITIAVDAGHGGEDPGAKGARGSLEKDVTLAIARRVKEQIDKQENMRAVLIRDGDYFVPLYERVVKARRNQADLFVSIHADAFLKSTARGSSVFALSESGATSAAARWLAKKENDADLIGGVSLANYGDETLRKTLLDLSQTATIADSLKVARAVLLEIGAINTLHKGDVEQAGFAVLKAPDIPSILVETAFISNPEEEKRLTDDAYQDKMAAAIVTGIKNYFEKNPPLARSRVAQNF